MFIIGFAPLISFFFLSQSTVKTTPKLSQAVNQAISRIFFYIQISTGLQL